MSHMKKYEFERTFENHTEFHARVDATILKDKIYRGIFEKTLLNKLGFSDKELYLGEQEGWLKRHYVHTEAGLRASYLWLLEEMPQRNPLKVWIDKAYRYVRGEYKRYYGAASDRK